MREIPARMQALAGLGGMSPATLQSQLTAAVQVVLHMRRGRNGTRFLDAVGVVHRGPSGEGPGCDDGADAPVQVSPAWTRDGGSGPGLPALDVMLRERGVTPPW